MNGRIRSIPLGKLITSENKFQATMSEIERGELSHSYGVPCVVSYCPALKKYLIMDGNHRAIEQAMQGHSFINCVVNEFQPRYFHAVLNSVTIKICQPNS